MAVPKATMKEHHLLLVREHEIRAAGQIPDVRMELVAERTNDLGKDFLWSSILAPYAPHVFASLSWREVVHKDCLDREIERKIRDISKASPLD